MTARDPQRDFAVEVVRRLKEAGHEALWAGGCVRDILLGRQPEDYDVATDARPEEVRRLFGKRRTLAVGASFGVIIVLGPNKAAGQVEVATFRTEGPYLDGRRPDTEHIAFSSPEEDARRRDFTINGMFYDPVAHRVHDYVGGEKDLGEEIIRAIGDPRERMDEDKLRLLRTVRFAATLDFAVDPATADALREMAGEIRIVSAERIAQELRRMLVDPHRRRGVELTRELGLLTVILPELGPLVQAFREGEAPAEPILHVDGVGDGSAGASPSHEGLHDDWQRTLHMLHLLQEPDFETAAAVLLHAVPAAGASAEQNAQRGEIARRICKRLRLSNEETDRISWLVARQDDLTEAPRMSPAQMKRLFAHPYAEDLLTVFRVKSLAADADWTPVAFCEDFLRDTPPEALSPPALLTGDDLIATGLKPGPHFKEILEAVRDAQLNGEITTREEALKLVERRLEDDREPGGQMN